MSSEILLIPTIREVDATAPPLIHPLMCLVAALARRQDRVLTPQVFKTLLLISEEIGEIFDEPSFSKVTMLRALAERTLPIAAIIREIKNKAKDTDVLVRSRIIGLLIPIMPAIKIGVDGTSKDIADALGQDVPDQLRAGTGGYVAINIMSSFYKKSTALVRTDDILISNLRDLATYFNDTPMLRDIDLYEKGKDKALIVKLVPSILEKINCDLEEFGRCLEGRETVLNFAQELDAAASSIEIAASQKFVAMVRRSELMRRHLRDELNALVEDAVEEFEVDFRRLAEKKGWFGSIQTDDLNNRLVIKNLHRRYKILAQRYQEQLDLLEREVSEHCFEFTKLSDEAFRPMARYDFKGIAPKPSLELRVKAAADRASSRTMVGGAVAATASGAAIHAGIITAAAMTGLALTPAGVVVLGSIAAAGVWKMFASPKERNRRDPRERAKTLEEALREEIMSNLPRFEAKLDEVLAKFKQASLPDITQSRVEAIRLREIEDFRHSLVTSITKEMKDRARKLADFV